MHLIVEFI